jgi:hypothetical protein
MERKLKPNILSGIAEYRYFLLVWRLQSTEATLGLKYHPMKLVTESLGYRNLVFKFEITRYLAEEDFLRDLIVVVLFNVFKRPAKC